MKSSMTDTEMLLNSSNRLLVIENSPMFEGKNLQEVSNLKVKALLKQLKSPEFYYFSSNKVYQGEMKNKKPWGRGILKVSSTDVYFGMFKEEKVLYKVEHFAFQTNTHFVGLVDDDLKYHGFGTMTIYPSKEVYTGEFKHGMRHGSGQQVKKGIAFMGTFIDDFPCENGSGVYVRLSDNTIINSHLK